MSHNRSKSMDFNASQPAKLSPPHLSKRMDNNLSPRTNFNTLDRCSTMHSSSLSAIRPYKSEQASPQPNEKPFTAPSPKPRHILKYSHAEL